MIARIRSLVNALVHRTRFEDGMADEMRFHLEAYADDLVRAGVAPAEARRRARLEFGGLETAKENARQAVGLRLFDELGQDVRYALRQMRKSPGFTAAALVSLALGIGANTAIFSLMDFVILKSVPVNDPEQLYFLAHGAAPVPSLSSNYPLLERYRTGVDVFSGVTAYNVQQFKVATEAGTELVDGQFVAGNYHDVLGVPFVLGRGFVSESDRPTDGSLVAVISGNYWSRRFGRDSNVIGKTLSVQGKTVTIVGVTAPEFHGLRPGTQFDVTVPLAQRVIDEPGFVTMRDSWTSLNLVGRLKAGVTEAQALVQINPVFRQFWFEPDNAWARGLSEKDHPARLSPAGKGTEGLRSQYRESLQVLMAMVALVLLIACCNVANLLLVRASARVKEVAVRMSVGAGRGRLVRQFLTESTVLAIGGGILGLLFALWGTSTIASMLRAGNNPILVDIEPNARVLAFTTAVSVLTGIVFGLVPSFKATRLELTPSLKATPGAEGHSRRFSTGKALVACQLALCLLLLAGSGLLVRSLVNLNTLEAGFRKDNLLLFWLDTRGTKTEIMELSGGLLERLQALPGVRTASLSTMAPLATNGETRAVHIPDLPAAEQPRTAVTNRVTAEYFPTLEITILRGRGISAQDSSSAPRVAVVNETIVREYFGGGDPIGRTFSFGITPTEPVTIVGVARDARQFNLRQPVPRMVYVPVAQAEEGPRLLTATIRTLQAPRSLEATAREAVRAVSPDLVMFYVRTMEEQLEVSLIRERLLATLSIAFVVLALALACIGLYGVMAYTVVRRIREIGIRIALGAARTAVLWQVLREALVISMAGIAIGLVGAMFATRLVSTFLFGLTTRDPLTFASAAVMLLVISLTAAYLPARRAAGIDPVRALKTE